MDFYFFLLRLIFSFFFLTVPLPWKLYMLVYMDVSYCMYISWQNYQRKRRRKKSTSKLERPTRMSYPTWGALLHMAMSHSCLNHKIDELSLVFSAKSPSQRSSTLTMSLCAYGFLLHCPQIYLYYKWLFGCSGLLIISARL